jgi:hypothetical protein
MAAESTMDPSSAIHKMSPKLESPKPESLKEKINPKELNKNTDKDDKNPCQGTQKKDDKDSCNGKTKK